MRKYRYYFAFIITLFVSILVFFYSKNTINLMDYVVYYYTETENGYKPEATIDYLALSSYMGSVSEEEMSEKVGNENILESLAKLFTSNYSSLINSIEVKPNKDLVKEGDILKFSIKWNKDLEKETGLYLTSYNNYIIVKEPENNTIMSSIVNYFVDNSNYIDTSKEYFSPIPLSNEKYNVLMFEKYKVINYDNEKVTIKSENNEYVINRNTFENYFKTTILESLPVFYNLTKNDLKFGVSLTVIMSFILTLIYITQSYLLKEKDKFHNYLIGIAVFICFILNRFFEMPLFKIPNNGGKEIIIFSIELFIIISIIFELLTSFSLKNALLLILNIISNLILIVNPYCILCIISLFLIEKLSLKLKINNKKQTNEEINQYCNIPLNML